MSALCSFIVLCSIWGGAIAGGIGALQLALGGDWKLLVGGAGLVGFGMLFDALTDGSEGQ